VKKFLIAAVCVLAVVALYLYSHSNRTAPALENPPAQEATANKVGRPAGVYSATGGATSNSANATATANQPSSTARGQAQDLSARAGEYVPPATVPIEKLPPETVLQNVGRAVRQYGQMFGGNPVGTNPEITAALQGQNPKKINFLAGQDGMRVDDQGELVDVWGTPYFFHQVSGTEMEIHSAGPDKQMWTSDDLVTRESVPNAAGLPAHF
jgi:hypothetical protein